MLQGCGVRRQLQDCVAHSGLLSRVAFSAPQRSPAWGVPALGVDVISYAVGDALAIVVV